MQRPQISTSDLGKAMVSRRSYRDFSKKPVSLNELSKLLYFSAGITYWGNSKDIVTTRRTYPSAGAKYPLEIYPLILQESNLKRGLYHYNVIEHSLEILLNQLTPPDTKNIWMSQKWFRKSSIILIITAVLGRITQKYGEKGIGYSLIEAGHLGQNVYLIANQMGIGCSAIGEFREDGIIKLLDINPDEEIPVYYLALGN